MEFGFLHRLPLQKTVTGDLENGVGLRQGEGLVSCMDLESMEVGDLNVQRSMR
jgi:hypothetical protein